MNVHSAKRKKKNTPPPASLDSFEDEPVDTKRELILRAALEVFSETGVHGTAVPRIAQAAEVGVGTLYRYFANKEVLVNELFRDTKRKLKARLTDRLDLAQEPRQLFHDFWRRLVDFAVEEPLAFQFLEMQDHMPYLDDESMALELEVLAPIYRVCAELRKKGVFNEAMRIEVAMAFIWGAFVGVFKAERYEYLDASQADLDSVRDACWRALTKPGKGR